jgi:hypothetical protein
VQTPLAQSPVAAHALPAAHAGHAGPPQSTPDSFPFFAPSLHEPG